VKAISPFVYIKVSPLPQRGIAMQKIMKISKKKQEKDLLVFLVC
jgi:hypothetical protein